MQDMIRRVLHRNTITSQDQCVRIQKNLLLNLFPAETMASCFDSVHMYKYL